MNPTRFTELTAHFPHLRIAVVGDFCLDRYLEIDPTKAETSIETGLPVHNVVNVRTYPGAAGTILNNLAALGIGTIYPVGFAGNDSEGRVLCDTLGAMPGVRLGFFFRSDLRRTFCYTKPLIVESGKPPVELSRLDFKNWTPTPFQLEGWILDAVRKLASLVDAVIVLDQVDLPETGVITARVRHTLGEVAAEHPNLVVLADSRRGLQGWPALGLKMNAQELAVLTGSSPQASVSELTDIARALARKNGRPVFVTLSERGLLGAVPRGDTEHLPSLPLRGEIDIVGAGDSVTANLTSALAAGASLREALELANTAASIVIHQLGTTGTANVPQIAHRMFGE